MNAKKNDSSSLQDKFDGFEEVDEDLKEIVRSYERKKEEALEVRVLVIKPGNKQRLLTCDVPLHCDERDILIKVHKLFADRKYYVNMCAMNVSTFGFDYIVEYYENDNGRDLDSIMNDYLRENCQIPECEDSGALDDEVIEVTRNEAGDMCDNDEIEEIRVDDDVFIEKVILKHDLLEQAMDEAAGTVDVGCEKMEVDVIPMERHVAPIEEDNEIEELPAPIKNFSSQSEEEREVQAIRKIAEKCVKEIEEEYSMQINEGAKENADLLDVTQMVEGDKETEEGKQFGKEVRKSESEREMEEDEPSFEEVTENESVKQVDGVSADFEEVTEAESVKEVDGVNADFEGVRGTESEKEMERDVETVCIADDPLDDDGNENGSQTSGDKTILFIYPMSRGGITVTRDDYKCLSECQYLNDIIIDFYLNYLMQEVLSQKDRERTHLFSSHFYTRLTKPIVDEDSANLSLDERRYAGVQRWTKDVNIFEKDFIIVPINEYSHWFLAIICFPKLVDFVGWRDFDCEIDGIESQKPCILIFDSLGASKKTQVAVTLRGYLRHEYMAKMKEAKKFTSDNLKTLYPKTVCQQNATDCGLFVLQYVESFFNDPLLDFTLPLKDLSDWFSPTVIERKRERIAKLIAKLAIKYNKGKIVKLPMLKFSKPKLLKSLEQAKKCETSAKSKKKVQPKKKAQTKRTVVSERLKKLCDSDSDSDSDTTLPASSAARSRLRVSSHNPQPLRRSAYLPRSQVPKYFSFDDSDDSTPSTNTTSTVPSTFLKDGTAFDSSSKRTASSLRTYQGPLGKWKDFSKDFGDLTESKQVSEKQDVSSSHDTTRSILMSGGIRTDRFYNLSLDALNSSPSIPPTMSFSQYRIKKKNQNSDV